LAYDKGRQGEELVASLLSTLDPKVYLVFSDIILYDNLNNPTQLDHLVLSPYGLFIIETKNYSGTVYCEQEDRDWAVKYDSSAYTFYNPVKQNIRHKRTLFEVLKPLIGFNSIIDLVCFVGDAKLRGKEQIPSLVSKEDLVPSIEGVGTLFFTQDELKVIESHLRSAIRTGEGVSEELSSYVESVAGVSYETRNKINYPKKSGEAIVIVGLQRKHAEDIYWWWLYKLFIDLRMHYTQGNDVYMILDAVVPDKNFDIFNDLIMRSSNWKNYAEFDSTFPFILNFLKEPPVYSSIKPCFWNRLSSFDPSNESSHLVYTKGLNNLLAILRHYESVKLVGVGLLFSTIPYFLSRYGVETTILSIDNSLINVRQRRLNILAANPKEPNYEFLSTIIHDDNYNLIWQKCDLTV
jgi:hypothetical protein